MTTKSLPGNLEEGASSIQKRSEASTIIPSQSPSRSNGNGQSDGKGEGVNLRETSLSIEIDGKPALIRHDDEFLYVFKGNHKEGHAIGE